MTDREIDALVAERVMGCKVQRDYGRVDCLCDGEPHRYGHDERELIAYSSTGDGMLAVIEAMVQRDYVPGMGIRENGVRFFRFEKFVFKDGTDGWDLFVADGDTYPRAVAIAALRALGWEGEE